MDNVDLLEMRKKIHQYKQTGKQNTIGILKQLQILISSLTPQQKIQFNYALQKRQLEDSKICKTLHHLSQVNASEEVDENFSLQDLKYLKEMSRSLILQFKEILKGSSKKDRKSSVVSNVSGKSRKSLSGENEASNLVSQTPNQEMQQEVIPNLKKKKPLNPPLTQSQSQSQTISHSAHKALLIDLNFSNTFSEQRIKVVDKLLQVLLKNHEKLKPIGSFPQAKFALIAKRLEEEAFLGRTANQYQSLIKEMIQGVNRDSDGSVRWKFLSGHIEPSQAVLMRTEDWIGEQRLIESRKEANEHIASQDIQHYKRLAMEINKDTVLAECSNCKEKKLKLIDEKQTRASDEPSTKFFECLNCGYAETTN